MALFSERNGHRQSIQRDDVISVDKYKMLFECCQQYIKYLSWLFPLKDTDGNIEDFDVHKFEKVIEYKIPSLYRSGTGISVPYTKFHAYSEEQITQPEYDQIALLDYIEYIAENIRDLKFNGLSVTPYFFTSDTHDTRAAFRDEINNIFNLTNLLFWMNEEYQIERVADIAVLSEDIEAKLQSVHEPGLKQLLVEATQKFKSYDPAEQKDAVEKMWDAFERLKTYYAGLDKKKSIGKIIDDMANGDTNYETLFEAEFRALTDIGNNYRIRHHETSKIEINDPRYYDYFFNRCLSLIAIAIEFLDPLEYQTNSSN